MIENSALLLGYGAAVGVLAGGIGGVLAGLAGVGGGLIYVPLLYALMPGLHAGAALPVMVSLIGVFLTGLFSARAHWRLGHVSMPASRQLLPFLVVGAALGLWSTLRLPESLILLGLGLLDAWVAWDMGRRIRIRPGRQGQLGLWGGPIGYLSGTLGIGGGTMLVPLLRRVVSLREAVGTAALCGTAMAGSAALINLIVERRWDGLVADQWPFLLGALVGLVGILPFATRFSAHLHRAWPEHTVQSALRALFMTLAAILVVSAVYTAQWH